MPPLPKKQLSKSKQNHRASHYKFHPVARALCPQCHTHKLPHQVCPSCGYYRGKAIVQVSESEGRQ